MQYLQKRTLHDIGSDPFLQSSPPAFTDLLFPLTNEGVMRFYETRANTKRGKRVELFNNVVSNSDSQRFFARSRYAIEYADCKDLTLNQFALYNRMPLHLKRIHLQLNLFLVLQKILRHSNIQLIYAVIFCFGIQCYAWIFSV